MLIQINCNQKFNEKYGGGYGHKWACSLWLQDSKIVGVSQEKINGVNWFWVSWYKLRKT